MHEKVWVFVFRNRKISLHSGVVVCVCLFDPQTRNVTRLPDINVYKIHIKIKKVSVTLKNKRFQDCAETALYGPSRIHG